MDIRILQHYLEFGTYTNPGPYEEVLRNDLPDGVREIGLRVRQSLIHRTTLAAGNTGTNADLRYGDMTKVPWYRQPEDDILVTAAAMLAELYRRDSRGLVMDRDPANKLVLTCRFTAILMASVLKSKNIPCRVRSGNAGYWGNTDEPDDSSGDHWVNQYWDSANGRWVTIDVDGGLNVTRFDPYDIPEGRFDFPASTWLGVRSGTMDAQRFTYANGTRGTIVVLWALFYDFHSLMNSEIIYLHRPIYGASKRFANLTPDELEKIDSLARLMLDPDGNFDELQALWETERDFRLLKGGLL